MQDFDQFNSSMDLVGNRKRPAMTGSDISAYLTHMAQKFHQSSGGGGMVSRTAPTKESMKLAIIESKNAAKVAKIPPPPSKLVPRKMKAITAPNSNAQMQATKRNQNDKGEGEGEDEEGENGDGEKEKKKKKALEDARKKKEEDDVPNLKEIARLNQVRKPLSNFNL